MKPAKKPTGKKVPFVFSWAVPAKDNLTVDSADDEPPYEENRPDCEPLEDEVRTILPIYLLQVRDELERVLDHGVGEVRDAWPSDPMHRLRLLAEINKVAVLLLRLFDTRPIEDEELAKSA